MGELIGWVVGEIDRSPTAQALFFLLVVAGRFALDRWERNRERRLRRMRRMIRDG